MSTSSSKLPPVKRNSRAQSPPKQAHPKKFTVQQMDSSAYRLSRPKTNLNNINTNEKPEFWAENYYNTDANAVLDKRLPNEKLEEIDTELDAGDLDYKAKLHLLIQKKQLKFIIFGENSIEALESTAELGYHYNHNNRPTSALRHLQKAYSLESIEAVQRNLTNRLKDEIDVEIAEAHFSIYKLLIKSSDKKEVREARKNLSQTNSVLNRIQHQTQKSDVAEEEDEEDNERDAEIQFRISVLRARVLNTTNQFSQAVIFYTEAMNIYELAYGPEETLYLADLHHEAADNAHAAIQSGDSEEATKKAAAYHYRSAYDLYVKLNAQSEAQKIKPLLDQYENDESSSDESDLDSDSDKPVDVKASDVQQPTADTADKSDDSEADNFENNEPIEEYKPITTDDKVYTPPSSSSSAKSSQNSSPRDDKIKLGGTNEDIAKGLLGKSDDFDDDDSFESKESFETEKKEEEETKKSDSNSDDDFESKDESDTKKSSSSESDDEGNKSGDEEEKSSRESNNSDNESKKSEDDFETKEDTDEKDDFMAGSGDENECEDEFGFEI